MHYWIISSIITSVAALIGKGTIVAATVKTAGIAAAKAIAIKAAAIEAAANAAAAKAIAIKAAAVKTTEITATASLSAAGIQSMGYVNGFVCGPLPVDKLAAFAEAGKANAFAGAAAMIANTANALYNGVQYCAINAYTYITTGTIPVWQIVSPYAVSGIWDGIYFMKSR